MLKEIVVKTNKSQEIIEITNQVKTIVKASGIKQGICIIYAPHATAGILINENYDSNICQDIIKKLVDIIPLHDGYLHDKIDNNAHSHIKASLIGPSETVIIEDGQLMLGTWQGIGLAEFDGPRQRKVLIKIIG